MSIYPPTGTLEIKNATLKIPVIDLQYTSNTAKIEANSNVVTEFSRSKKLIKYPRVALTSASTPTGYVVDVSDQQSGNNAWEAFDNNAHINTDYRWRTNDNRYTDNSSSGTPSSPTAAASTYLFTGSEAGDWISVEIPEKMKLVYFTITGIHYHTPYEGVIYGYNTTTSTWERVSSFINSIVHPGDNRPLESPQFHTDESNTKYYSKYAMIVVKTNGHHAPSMYEWKLYGIPEYDPEAHGTDVVVKSLPNVPNTDWLEVYYDAKNYSGAGDVQDETANNRDAEMNATFDNGEIKAFNFSGAYTSNVTTSDHGLGTGDVTYTMSYWFKRTAVAGTYDYVVMLGDGGVLRSSILMWINNNQLTLDHWNAALRVLEPIVLDRWYHVAAGHSGGNTPNLENDFIYINGKRVTPQITQTAGSFTLAGSKLTLGSEHNGTTEFLNGSIANFRLFNRALTTDEVWQLYAYQKEYFGHGDLGMTLKAGRLGIGTSEPRAALDVQGIPHGPNSRPCWTLRATSVNSDNFAVWDQSDVDNFNGATGDTDYIIPVSGYYFMQAIVIVAASGGRANLRFYKNGTGIGSNFLQDPVTTAIDASRPWNQLTGIITYYFKQGDVVKVSVSGSTYSSYNCFTGFHLGF